MGEGHLREVGGRVCMQRGVGRAATVQGVDCSAWASELAEWTIPDVGSDLVEEEGPIEALPWRGRVVQEPQRPGRSWLKRVARGSRRRVVQGRAQHLADHCGSRKGTADESA
jgi:hypothetical protein